MKIGTREVGPGHPTFIIAECGSNHGGSLDAALALIDAAADAGADAAKFQYFRVDRFIVPRENPEALRKYELPDEWLPALRTRCEEYGIEFLCTAFDLESLAAVDPFVNAHKIGSYEAAVTEFADAVATKLKPLMFSTGRAWSWTGMIYSQLTIALRCVSEYPAPVAGYLKHLPGGYLGWGVSDHTLDPLTVPCAAVALGACVVEKHMKMNWDSEFYSGITPDAAVSIGDDELAAMVRAIRATESAIRG